MPSATDTTTRAIRTEPLLIDLALQGGGSHGAFTWGVLDRILEEPWLQLEGISGTSAGAMNAAYETVAPVLVWTSPMNRPRPIPIASR